MHSPEFKDLYILSSSGFLRIDVTLNVCFLILSSLILHTDPRNVNFVFVMMNLWPSTRRNTLIITWLLSVGVHSFFTSLPVATICFLALCMFSFSMVIGSYATTYFCRYLTVQCRFETAYIVSSDDS